jgi:hypothetical protein
VTQKKSKGAAKLPFLKFYAQSWFGDRNLRLCSAAARGVWIDLLLVMHQDGKPYGHLAKDGVAMDLYDLAETCRVTVDGLREILEELERREVFSRRANGVIFSRKLVRDANVRANAKVSGSLGGNPVLRKRNTVKGDDNPSPYRSGLNTRVLDIKAKTEAPTTILSLEESERRRAVLESFGVAS